VSCRDGSADWDGEGPAVLHPGGTCPVVPGPKGPAGALAAFVTALRTGVRPENEIADNVRTWAMASAAIESAATGRRVVVD
jgi:hypothetical protein